MKIWISLWSNDKIAQCYQTVHYVPKRIMSIWDYLKIGGYSWEEFLFIITLKQTRTFIFLWYIKLCSAEIFQKNYRPGPLCVVHVYLYPCSILHRYSLSLISLNQKRKQLAVRIYFWWNTIKFRSRGISQGLHIDKKRNKFKMINLQVLSVYQLLKRSWNALYDVFLQKVIDDTNSKTSYFHTIVYINHTKNTVHSTLRPWLVESLVIAYVYLSLYRCAMR